MDPDRPYFSYAPNSGRPTVGYTLSELSAQTLVDAFVGSPYSASIDSRGRCIVKAHTLDVAVVAEPTFGALFIWVLFTTRGRREEILEFCNRFNQRALACRAQLREEPFENGSSVVIVSYERLTRAEERLTDDDVVRLVDRVAGIVNHGMVEAGPGDLVWDTLRHLDVDATQQNPN